MFNDSLGIGTPAPRQPRFAMAGVSSPAAAKASEAQKKATTFAAFLAEARKTPQERCKEEVMKEWGVTDASLQAMPVTQAKAMMDRIDQEVARRMQGLDPSVADKGMRGAIAMTATSLEAGEAIGRL